MRRRESFLVEGNGDARKKIFTRGRGRKVGARNERSVRDILLGTLANVRLA